MIEVKLDAKQFERMLSSTPKQVPFMISKTLNDLAKEGRKAVIDAEQSTFGMKKNFMRPHTLFKLSTKSNLESVIYLTEKLDTTVYMEQGGTRPPRNRKIAIRKAGRGKPAAVVRQKNVFSKASGIYRRLRGDSLSLLFRYVDKATYSATHFFREAVEDTVKTKYDKIVKANLDYIFRR